MPLAGALKAKFWRRRSPAEDKLSILEREEQREVEAPRPGEGQTEEEEELTGCASKTVALAALPDKYEPLAWDGEQQTPPPPRKTERASKARKRRLKKYGKNCSLAASSTLSWSSCNATESDSPKGKLTPGRSAIYNNG